MAKCAVLQLLHVLLLQYPTVTAAGIPWPKAAMRALTCGAGNGELLMAVYWNGTIAREYLLADTVCSC